MTREYTDEQGRTLREYDNGNVHDASNGRIVKAVLSHDRARSIVGQRIAKSQSAMRKAIIEATEASGLPGMGGVPLTATSASHAVGIAAGVLWEQGVLNPDARLIDRVKAWDVLGKAAGLLDDPRAPQPISDEQAAALGGVGAAALLVAMAEIERRKNE